jgi:hypothetical protein
LITDGADSRSSSLTQCGAVSRTQYPGLYRRHRFRGFPATRSAAGDGAQKVPGHNRGSGSLGEIKAIQATFQAGRTGQGQTAATGNNARERWWINL